MAKIGNTFREIAATAAREIGEEFGFAGKLRDIDDDELLLLVEEKIGFCPSPFDNVQSEFRQGFRYGWRQSWIRENLGFDWWD